jgi:FkbM family methyltransferase
MQLLNQLKSLIYQNCPKIIFRYLTNSKEVIKYLKNYNFSMVLSLEDYAISRPILVKGKYEQNVTKVLLNYLKNDLTFLDIGANLGYYSLLVASQCPEAKIYSFEPDQKNFHLFQTSIIYNQFQHLIQAYPLAVSNETKNIVISSLGNNGNFGARFTGNSQQDLIPHVHGENPYFREISAVSLDEFLPDLEVDLVKIDIEGYEPFAIQGMGELLRKNKPIILLEFAPSNLVGLGQTDPKQFLETFIELAYNFNVIDRQGKVISYQQDLDRLIREFPSYQSHHLDLLLTQN